MWWPTPFKMPDISSKNDSPEVKQRIEPGKKSSTFSPMYIQTIRRMESKIMKVTVAYGSTGISHTRLADLVGIDRKNLSAYTKRLIGRGLLRRGEGKQGRYYPSTQYKTRSFVTPDLFAKTAADEILANEDFDLNSPFFRNMDTTNLPEYALFLFSNKIGAVMTYLLIQSMSESNRIVTEPRNNHGSELDADRWMNDAIWPLVHFLLPSFRDVVISLVPQFKISMDDLIGIFDRPYALRESFISELLDSFCRSYPAIRAKLEHIKSRLPREVDRQIAHWEYVAYSSKQQKICKHEFKPPSNQRLVALINNNIRRSNNSNSGYNGILHCNKCHMIKYENSIF
jgi:hypothetical protein